MPTRLFELISFYYTELLDYQVGDSRSRIRFEGTSSSAWERPWISSGMQPNVSWTGAIIGDACYTATVYAGSTQIKSACSHFNCSFSHTYCTCVSTKVRAPMRQYPSNADGYETVHCRLAFGLVYSGTLPSFTFSSCRVWSTIVAGRTEDTIVWAGCPAGAPGCA
jgi:hypothetical protein